MHHPKDLTKQQVADTDFWASRVHSSKHFSAHSTTQGHQVMLNNSEPVHDDPRAYFTCPFCYVDTELSMLCNHFQEEHCFDVKNAVCPVCALNLGKDVVGHFKVHHAHSIKKATPKSGFWSLYAGRNMLAGLSANRGMETVNASALDPLLSPFSFSLPYLDSEDDQTRESCFSVDVINITDTASLKPSMSNESEVEGDSEEMRQRAAFCEQLILSTIL